VGRECNNGRTYAIVFRVDVEEAGFFDVVAGRIARETGDVDDAQAGGVV
jgi:hypothetical protein